MSYIWESKAWLDFVYDTSLITTALEKQHTAKQKTLNKKAIRMRVLDKSVLCIFAILLSLVCVSCKDTQVEDYLNYVHQDYSYSLEKNEETGEVYCPNANYVMCLEKDPAKDFVILNLSDFQEGHPKNATDFIAVIDELIKDVKPDLITITGDMSYGSATTVQQLGEIFEAYKIPWAPIFGNHDHDEVFTSIETQCTLYESFEHCLFKTGPQIGNTYKGLLIKKEVPRAGNYVINIVEKDEENNENGFSVVKTLVFLDTGNVRKYNKNQYTGRKEYANGSSYDLLLPQQVDFYNQVVDSAKKYGKNGEEANAILFIHIPIFEYIEAIGAALKTDTSVYNISEYMNYAQTISYEDSYNANIWNDGYETSFGTFHEKICYTPYDDYVFENIKDNTQMIISGHDHINTFVVDYKDVIFCYAMKTGHGSYHDKALNGGTVITISGAEKPAVKHQRYSKIAQ